MVQYNNNHHPGGWNNQGGCNQGGCLEILKIVVFLVKHVSCIYLCEQ